MGTTHRHTDELQTTINEIYPITSIKWIRSAVLDIQLYSLEGTPLKVYWNKGAGSYVVAIFEDIKNIEAMVAVDLNLAGVKRFVEENYVTVQKGSYAICGPNLNDQSKGQFHVHAEGCADLERGAQREPEYANPMIVEAASKVEICDAVYVPSDFECESGDYVNDFHFFPCCEALS